MKNVFIVLFYSLAFVGLLGCGGGATSKLGVNGKHSKTGVLLDSKVGGVYYKTSSGSSGITNKNGEYHYADGDILEFYVGDVKLGKAKGSQLTTVFDFEDPDKVAVLLQSLDKDGNPNNGIEISKKDFQKMQNSSFVLNEVDPESNSFREKFKTVMGYDIETDITNAEDHALQTLKEELIRRYDKDISLYLNEKVTVNGLMAADYTSNSVFGYNPNDYLHTYESRMRSYFFIKYALEFLKGDVEVYREAINASEVSQALIDKNIEKYTSMITGYIAITSLSKATKGNLNQLKLLKESLPEYGKYASKLHNTQMKKFISLKVGKDIFAKGIYDSMLSEKTIVGRMFKDCTPVGPPKVNDLMQCLSRAGGELLKSGNHIYGISGQIVSVRKRNAAILAMQYLELYYAFDKRSGVLSNIFTSLSASVGENYNFHNYNQDDDLQLDKVLNIISKKEFNKKYLLAAGWEYNFKEAKKLITNYQSMIEGLTSDFMNNFDRDTINTIDQDYADISLRLEQMNNSNYKVCLDITNKSSFSLQSPDARVNYFLDNQQIGHDSFVLDDLGTINPYVGKCTTEIHIQPEEVFIPKVLKIEYDLNYLPSRMDTDFKKQRGVKYFEVSKKSLIDDFVKPIINLRAPIFVKSGSKVTLDASATYSLNGEYLTYRWDFIEPSRADVSLYPYIQDMEASKTYFQAPVLPSTKVRHKLNFKLTVVGTDGKKSEKDFFVVVSNKKNGIGNEKEDIDTDNDGLSDSREIELGTDPNNPDTDGDGKNDSWENSHGLNPLIPESTPSTVGINGKILEQSDGWRAKIKIDTLTSNQKSATIDFRDLSCGGDLTYLYEQNGGYIFDEKITYGNCLQNCQVWIKSDGSYYEETCRGKVVSGQLTEQINSSNAELDAILDSLVPDTQDIPLNTTNLIWSTPSKSVCNQNGGVIEENGCRASWQEANNICSDIGSKLPTIEQFQQVISSCGGGISAEDNEECYKRKGFSMYYYWSSTTHDTSTYRAWGISFYRDREFSYSKLIDNGVRCVKF